MLIYKAFSAPSNILDLHSGKRKIMVMMIKTIDALRKIVATSNGDLYVRWSRGPKLDRKRGVSRDYVAGAEHVGLSAVPVDAAWATDDKWLARRVAEYCFLRIKGADIGCHIYRAMRVGTDSDGYALISNIRLIGSLNQDLITQLVSMPRK